MYSSSDSSEVVCSFLHSVDTNDRVKQFIQSTVFLHRVCIPAFIRVKIFTQTSVFLHLREWNISPEWIKCTVALSLGNIALSEILLFVKFLRSSEMLYSVECILVFMRLKCLVLWSSLQNKEHLYSVMVNGIRTQNRRPSWFQ